MNNANPFKRYNALRAAIAGAMVLMSGMQLSSYVGELMQSREFQSRGKGGGHRARGSRMGVTSRMMRQRSKYSPHQGVGEIARRAARMNSGVVV